MVAVRVPPHPKFENKLFMTFLQERVCWIQTEISSASQGKKVGECAALESQTSFVRLVVFFRHSSLLSSRPSLFHRHFQPSDDCPPVKQYTNLFFILILEWFDYCLNNFSFSVSSHFSSFFLASFLSSHPVRHFLLNILFLSSLALVFLFLSNFF